MIEDFENDEEMIEVAANGCYYPERTREQLAMRFIIERLVLPDAIDSFSKEEIVNFIRLELKHKRKYR